MSFQPIEPGLRESLFGTAEMSKFNTSLEEERIDKYYRRTSSRREVSHDLYQTILIVIVTAIIFIIIVSVFDIIKNIITSYYITRSLRDPKANNTPEDIARTEIADTNAILSSVVFAIIAIIIGLIIIYFIMIYFWRRKEK